MRYRVADMHTAGEPVRIILDGHPPPVGATILAKRADAQRRFDDIRRTLMYEPPGYADMSFQCAGQGSLGSSQKIFDRLWLQYRRVVQIVRRNPPTS